MSTVEDYMSTKLVICDLQSSIFELAKVMVGSNVSSVAVAEEKGEGRQQQLRDDTRVVGILTERDIIRSIAKGGRLDDITAVSVMSSSPILSVRKGQSIEEAALLMIRNKVRHLLVEDPDNNNSVMGIITTTDLARYLQKRMKGNNSIVTASVGEEENKEQQREGQDKQEQSSPISSERLLSEVWELYF